MTTLFYKAVILQGEICCSSLLELKGLRKQEGIVKKFKSIDQSTIYALFTISLQEFS